jgi:hypothetical protein
MKKLMAIVFVVLLIGSSFVGCTPSVEHSDEESLPEDGSLVSATANDNPEHTESCMLFDFNGAFEAFPADTAMIIVGDEVVTWEQLFISLYSSIMDLIIEADNDIGENTNAPD